MKRGQPLGLDELMIVNPGSPGAAGFFLGADGLLYQVQGLGHGAALQGVGQFWLGDDGILYQVQGLGAPAEVEPGRFFLGEDGTLYELIR
jgi:hypothetical protein